MKTAILIPALNEAQTIGEVATSVRPFVDEIIVIDDGSTDDTGLRAFRAGAKVLTHILNRGQGAALATGIEAALKDGAEIIVTFDADGQLAAEDIPKMIAPLKDGAAEIVLGSRFLGQAVDMPFARKMILKLAVFFTRITSGLRVTDTHNGFRAMNRRAASLLDLSQDRMAHASEIISQIAKFKLAYKEAPVTVRYTPRTLSKGQRTLNAFRILFELTVKRLVR